MRVRLHLISPPWAPINVPSAQLGALHGYVEQELKDRVELRSYSAFLELPYRYRESSCLFFYADFKSIGEELFMLIYRSRYLSDRFVASKKALGAYLDKLNSFCLAGSFSSNCSRGQPQSDPFSADDLAAVEARTLDYVDERIVPELIDDGVNVVGFSMNFSQVYPSLLLARMIRERAPGKNILFLFGGFSASLPDFLPLLKRLGLDGYAVFGEGEHRLAAVARDLLERRSFDGALAAPINGVFRVGEAVDLTKHDESLFRSQLKDLVSMPVPNFDEYFELHARLSAADPFFARLVPPRLAVEGSRGCFAKCDFCNLNLLWSGFRKLGADQVLDRIRALHRRYGPKNVYFVDNVCDTFAEAFAERKIATGEKFAFAMSLRAHHPASFWIKLSEAGMDSCLVGVESLSAPLLRHMSKGTLLIQNLRVLKLQKELGVGSGAGIVTHHPRATREDALETLRMLEELSHLDPLEDRPISLGFGSPLYKALAPAVAAKLKPWVAVPPPPSLASLSVSHGYELPAQYLLADAEEALWEKIDRVCRASMGLRHEERPVFRFDRERDGSLRVVDTRFGARKFRLRGLKARLFDLCHEGLKLEMLEERLGLPRAAFEDELLELVERRLVLHADSYYLTLAVRPRDEVLASTRELRPTVARPVAALEARAPA